MKLALNDFRLLRDFINEKTGIFLKDEKMYFLENRLDVRFRELNCENVQDYYRIIKYDASGKELSALVEILTTNETFFFRDIKQLNAFAYEALTQVAAAKREAGSPGIRIWSAGCSTGEEPYTLAMLASEVVKDMKVQILATDINGKVVDFAKKGIYSGRSLKDVPPVYLSKYFTKTDQGYAVNDPVRNMVEFMLLNLVDRTRIRLINNVDFIFCRNVLIYFNHVTAKQIINNFYDGLNKGGFIFLGLAESMHLFSGAFKLVKFSELFGYMKE